MVPPMPKLYIDEFVGVSNRFETLPLAFAIQKEYGHQIILDWHELDSFAVSGTTRDNPRRSLVRFYGARLPRWRAAGYTGSDTLDLGGQFADIDFGRSVDLDWI
ncbi:MAG: hypothetical protein WBI05_04060 [Rhodoferax sp.]|uniref:hypothetical protein n=2 Tax=Rhodoferax sp. TaxID=50421 RepID=UPI003BB7ABFF